MKSPYFMDNLNSVLRLLISFFFMSSIVIIFSQTYKKGLLCNNRITNYILHFSILMVYRIAREKYYFPKHLNI